MANTKLNLDTIFQLVMTCRQSGMSDRQWCMEQDINPSTFYYWVKRLRDHACYEVPENTYHSGDISDRRIVKQDVVKVEILPEEPVANYASLPSPANTSVVIQYQEATILLQDNFNPSTLKAILVVLKESLC